MCEAICGESFCVRCGDCIACSWDNECYDGQSHVYPTPEALAEQKEQIALMFAVLEARQLRRVERSQVRLGPPVRYPLPARPTGSMLRGGPFDGERVWFSIAAIRPDGTITLPVPVKNVIGVDQGLPSASDTLQTARYRLRAECDDLFYDEDGGYGN